MAIESICGIGAGNVLSSFVLPMTALTALVTGMIIALCYMFGNATNNPKVLLWAKTEIVQLFISLATVGILFGIIASFCAIDLRSILTLFDVPSPRLPANPLSVYDGGELYLVQGGIWVHDILSAARYHLGGFNILEMYGRWICDGPAGSPAVDFIFCIFGNALSLGGGTGISASPDSGWAYLAPALSVSFNTLVFSYLSILNYLFILRYVYSGFVFFFLPVGIFLRSMPFMRGLGSLMISVTISFLFIYPLVLSVFYLDFLSSRILAPEIHAPANTLPQDLDRNRFFGVGYYAREDVSTKVNILDAIDIGGLSNDVFDFNRGAFGGTNDRSFEILQLSANAFLVGVFIPSVALLATLASIAYINRFLGEDIDLSRIVQVI